METRLSKRRLTHAAFRVCCAAWLVTLSVGCERMTVGLSSKSENEPRKSAPGAMVYKSVAGRELRLFVFKPDTVTQGRPLALVVHGGGWRHGKPDLMFELCRHLASRGMVAASVEYRVTGDGKSDVFDCIADARSAVRWARANAATLGIDPRRIVLIGESAGGHLAACVGLIDAHDEPGEDRSISVRPDSLILFNPIVDTTLPGGWDVARFGGPAEKRVAPRSAEFSPMGFVRPGLPPTLVLHGDADTVTPIEGSRRFVARMREAGNQATLVELHARNHAFIVPGFGDAEAVRLSHEAIATFLKANGLDADAPPHVAEP